VFSPLDTIVAIATPPGRGGLGVVRISGPAAHSAARAITSHPGPFGARYATLTSVGIASPAGHAPVDQAVVTFFPAPASYTGDDVVELSLHGSPVVLATVVEAAVAAGCRVASPGEFTLRAFLNGRIDLTQAEAVADLIDAATPLQARAAFDQLQGTLTREIAEIDGALFDLIARLEASVDFPDEGYHFIERDAVAARIGEIAERTAALLARGRTGRFVREGLLIAIVGKPNVGKSSLFNALAGSARAIVTDIPGTTRDLVTETVDLHGLRVTLTDSAGLRDTDDPVEREGVDRSLGAARVADLVLVITDRSRPWDASANDMSVQIPDNKRVIVANKSDLTAAWHRQDAVEVSAVTGAGLDALVRRITGALDIDLQNERADITNVRHIALVRQAHDALLRARDAASVEGGSLAEEFVLADLQQARAALEEVAGRRTPDDLLAHIFDRFCVGK
jgi:tRNA modification GTPase